MKKNNNNPEYNEEKYREETAPSGQEHGQEETIAKTNTLIEQVKKDTITHMGGINSPSQLENYWSILDDKMRGILENISIEIDNKIKKAISSNGDKTTINKSKSDIKKIIQLLEATFQPKGKIAKNITENELANLYKLNNAYLGILKKDTREVFGELDKLANGTLSIEDLRRKSQKIKKQMDKYYTNYTEELRDMIRKGIHAPRKIRQSAKSKPEQVKIHKDLSERMKLKRKTTNMRKYMAPISIAIALAVFLKVGINIINKENTSSSLMDALNTEAVDDENELTTNNDEVIEVNVVAETTVDEDVDEGSQFRGNSNTNSNINTTTNNNRSTYTATDDDSRIFITNEFRNIYTKTITLPKKMTRATLVNEYCPNLYAKRKTGGNMDGFVKELAGKNGNNNATPSTMIPKGTQIIVFEHKE